MHFKRQIGTCIALCAVQTAAQNSFQDSGYASIPTSLSSTSIGTWSSYINSTTPTSFASSQKSTSSSTVATSDVNSTLSTTVSQSTPGTSAAISSALSSSLPEPSISPSGSLVTLSSASDSSTSLTAAQSSTSQIRTSSNTSSANPAQNGTTTSPSEAGTSFNISTANSGQTDTAYPSTLPNFGPSVITAVVVQSGSTKTLPVISGGDITSAIPISATPITLDPSGTEASSSASAIQSQIILLVPLIQSYIDNPDPPKASDAINLINKIEPTVESLFGKISPSGSQKNGKDCSASTNLVSDIINAVRCTVDNLNKAADNIESGIKNGFKDIGPIGSTLENIKGLENGLDEENKQEDPTQSASQTAESPTPKASSTSPSSESSQSCTQSSVTEDLYVNCYSTSAPGRSGQAAMSCLTSTQTISGCDITAFTTTTTSASSTEPVYTAWFDLDLFCTGSDCADFTNIPETIIPSGTYVSNTSVQSSPSSTSSAISPTSSSSVLTDSSGGYLSGVLPKLSTNQCVDSTLVNCQWIFQPATLCPTTTQLLPASCTGAVTTTTPASSGPAPSSPSQPAPTPTIIVRLELFHLEHAGVVSQNEWDLFLAKPGATIDVCEGSQAGVYPDDIIKQTDIVDTKIPPWPSGSFKLTSAIGDNCVYTGTQAGPGTVNCTGKTISCHADAQAGTVISCPSSDSAANGDESLSPKVVCEM